MAREIVIIVSDLYFPAPDADAHSNAERAPPGLEQVARFGQKHSIEEGWRAWLARWLGRADLASAAPAPIAAAKFALANGTAWLATPMHLAASLTSLHLDRRSLLYLGADDLARLAEDFQQAFADCGFRLTPLDSGVFLVSGPDTLRASTTEPARALIREVGASLPTGPSASVLKRLGAELEMWLHHHPINQVRAQRGELPVSTLWLWGGGDVCERASPSSPKGASPDLAFGSEPYLVGLWDLHGAERHPLPDSLPDLSRYPQAQRAVVVTEVTRLLHANAHWTVFNALADLDRRFVVPALSELHGGTASSVVLIANDTALRVQRHDRLKFWRRRYRAGIDALR